MPPIPLGLARVPTLLRPRTGALRRGYPPAVADPVLFGPFSSLQSKVQDVTIEPYGLPDHSTALSFWGVLQARGA